MLFRSTTVGQSFNNIVTNGTQGGRGVGDTQIPRNFYANPNLPAYTQATTGGTYGGGGGGGGVDSEYNGANVGPNAANGGPGCVYVWWF